MYANYLFSAIRGIIMLQVLKTILEIQEFDIKMLRLMKVKKERQSELEHIASLRFDLKSQLIQKEAEIEELSKTIIQHENKISEIKEKLKKLEGRQGSIKKVEEFNALTQEMSTAEKERLSLERTTSDLIDKKNSEEEILEKIRQSLSSTEESSKVLEKDIVNNIKQINAEGKELKSKRDALTKKADAETFKIYEKLLKNKKDKVVVPMATRTCSGCHIALTAQHENSVRKGERLIFCEHCSRILYWQESEDLEGTLATPKRRRRRTKS
ncbi:MAG: hypothetical protein K1060chlam5_00362 [Candidatus Anoxychlamydiales bacterium]|nr:hypothetical protein [Candidatus Anoxychlamydiales bacterium]